MNAVEVIDDVLVQQLEVKNVLVIRSMQAVVESDECGMVDAVAPQVSRTVLVQPQTAVVFHLYAQVLCLGVLPEIEAPCDLEIGGRDLYPVGSVVSARTLARDLASGGASPLLLGEENAIPPEGFDLGNSPLDLSREVVRAHSCAVMSTSNGTVALLSAASTGVPVLAACVRNASRHKPTITMNFLLFTSIIPMVH